MKLLIKGTTIVDGSSDQSFYGDVLMEDGIIKEVGSIPDKTYTGTVIIDGKGLVTAPGFIDTHSHSDLKVLTEPEILPKVMQGITTEVLGQDGISMAPLPKQYIDTWRKNLAGLDGESDLINWDYETTKNYLKMIEAVKPGLNEAYLVPHGNIRMEAMGLDNRQPDNKELEIMCRITRREMEAGCLGLSSGLIYTPCAYSATSEIIELCKVVAEYEGVFVVHQRSEADGVQESMEEILEVGRRSGVKIHFSHFKVCGKDNWDKLEDMLKLLDQAREEGIQVSFDQYPYVAGSTMLSVILPPWVHDGGTNELMKRLGDETLRIKMKEDIQNGIPGWDNFIRFAGVEGIFITSVATDKNKGLIGKNLKEIGELQGKDPLDAAFDLLAEEENGVGMVDFYGSEEAVIKILKRAEMNACTDGLLSGKPHPRVYGSFPRILGKYVREENALSLEEAIYKLTHKAAKAMNIKNRGLIKPGYYADITMFNPDTVLDQGTYTEPMQYPTGIAYVIINGEVVVSKGKPTGVRAGQVIRRISS
ncbi:D-aminoacylase [Anaerocolumna sp. AGMB13025]|uniref:N-acyl-D-amino-acid deacylase family protein n=1 Tax=Anaerocolumna sp. AGMB13025 TaxID=3039116 RepID=UPI00241DF37A|nr:D-aminoacylase [Anaerocolumna sp. AGMB13025]WFR57951.1 D-aminoacylase [Anaerocolumna sp. AGMB13025]